MSYDYRQMESIKEQIRRDHVKIHDITKPKYSSFQDVLFKHEDLFGKFWIKPTYHA